MTQTVVSRSLELIEASPKNKYPEARQGTRVSEKWMCGDPERDPSYTTEAYSDGTSSRFLRGRQGARDCVEFSGKPPAHRGGGSLLQIGPQR